MDRRSFIFGSSIAAAGIFTSLAEPARAADGFSVSTAKVDITPSSSLPMGGYGVDTPRMSSGVHSPLMARCLIIWEGPTPNVVVTVDVLGFSSSLHRQIRANIVALGIASSDFVLNSTHTHNAPALSEKLNPYISYNLRDTSAIDAYSSNLVATITSLVRSALRAPRTAVVLEYSVGDEDFSRNREGLQYHERAVPILTARSSRTGRPRAVLFSYGAHPVAAGVANRFDPDYPGQAITTIEANNPGCDGFFVLGPAGDQDPVSTQEGFARSDEYGHDLGLVVSNVIRTPGRSLSGPILSTLVEATLPLDVTNQPANLQAVAAAFDKRAVNAGDGYYRRHGQVMAAQARDHTFASTVSLPVQRWRFGGSEQLEMIFSGGELVSGYAVYFRNQMNGSSRLWISAYANEVPCYIPSDELLSRGGYAAGWVGDYPGIAGGSMTVYSYMGHFLGRPPGSSVTGVEQVMIETIQGLLR